MDNTDHIPHDVALASNTPVAKDGPRPLVTRAGLADAFCSVAALGVAGLLIANMVHGRLHGEGEIDTMRERANLSFLPVSPAQKQAINQQIEALEYQQFLKSEAARRERQLIAVSP